MQQNQLLFWSDVFVKRG